MSKEEKVTCDNCKKDLLEGLTQHDYGIEVSNYLRRCGGTAHTLLNIHPPLEATLHFCNINCLVEYFDNQKILEASKAN